MLSNLAGQRKALAVALTILLVVYIGWKITQSPEQALQFAFNGLSVGAVYALLAMGFTIVYSTVWFFDLYYGAAAALGAYGVFYLRSQETLGGLVRGEQPLRQHRVCRGDRRGRCLGPLCRLSRAAALPGPVPPFSVLG